MIVEVAHGHGGVALPDMAHEGRGRQRGAAEREKVGVLVFHGHAERFDPQLREPLLGLGQRGRFHAHSRQRPRKGLLIYLAGGTHRQFFHDADARDECGRHGFGQAGVRGLVIEALGLILEGNVAHQDGLAARGLLHGHGRVIDVIQGRNVGFDLTELNAAPANFHLVIHAADKVQPVLLPAHMVTGAIRTLPVHRLQRGVLLRILGRIQVGRESHAADHQLADAAHFHRHALLIDDHQVPTIQRQPNGHRPARQHLLRTGDDRGLGGAVGIPHFAVLGGQAVHQLLRAGFAADDEQADIIQRLSRPQARQGRHGRHDGDIAADEPRAQVHAGAHQRSRRRDQAATVAPGQPHFLAGGIEGDGQPGEHTILRAERPVRVIDQKEAGLGIHKGGRGTVAHGHALRLAGRTGGEDDPRGVFGARGIAFLGRLFGRGVRGVWARGIAQEAEAFIGKDAIDIGLAEDHLGALVWVIGVDRHVGRARRQGRQNGEVELALAGGHPDADAIAPAHTIGVQLGGPQLDFVDELGVGDDFAVVQRGGVWVHLRGSGDDVPQRARPRSRAT